MYIISLCIHTDITIVGNNKMVCSRVTCHNINLHKIEISTIASGIYEKMVTSASGLIVGIIAYVMYTLLTTMIDRSINKMEIVAMDFIDLLHKPAKK